MAKTKILTDSAILGDVAGHLRPVIDFLIDQGNVAITDKFTWDKDGIGTFLFKYPINTTMLNDRFEFPKSVRVGYDSYYKGGIVFDRHYGLKIHQGK